MDLTPRTLPGSQDDLEALPQDFKANPEVKLANTFGVKPANAFGVGVQATARALRQRSMATAMTMIAPMIIS